jgi:hypothetical protein
VTTIKISLETTRVTKKQVTALVRALNTQIARDFAPDWGRNAKVVSNTNSRLAWIVHLVDRVDMQNALGYHSTTNGFTTGRPVAYVGIGDVQDLGLDWTVTVSHEVLEMLGDPSTSLVKPYPNGQHVAYEACDPVEADEFGYMIGNVRVSNFVLQSWFDAAPTATKWDFCGTLKGPLTLAPGGYISVEKNGKWTQLMNRRPDVPSRAALSLRRPNPVSN